MVCIVQKWVSQNICSDANVTKRDPGFAGLISCFKDIQLNELQELELGVHYAGIKFPVPLLNVQKLWHSAMVQR